MEASGTPTPPSQPDQPATPAAPPPPPPTTTDDEVASGGWRALGAVLALALAFACAVMIIAMLDIADTPFQDACRADPTCTEYFDGSSAQRAVGVVLGFGSAFFAGIGSLFALYFTFTGRRGRTLLQLVAVAITLGVLSLLILAI